MKLYTEEQVITFAIKVLSDYEINGTFYNREKLKETLDVTPIELPSDEEIHESSPIVHINADDYYHGAKGGFKVGAKWMKEQILGKEDKTFKQKSKWTEVDNMTRRLK